MSNIKLFALASVLSFTMSGFAMAGSVVDCSNAANANKDECVRVKFNVNNQNDVVDCSNAANTNKNECVRAKVNVNNRNDVVHCSNAANGNKK